MKLATGVALICLDPRHCPLCGSNDLYETTTWQPALFIGCDYGAALATVTMRCHRCGWWIATGQETVSPRVFT